MCVLKSHHQHTRVHNHQHEKYCDMEFCFFFFLVIQIKNFNHVSSLWINVFLKSEKCKNCDVSQKTWRRLSKKFSLLSCAVLCVDNRKNCNLFIWFAMKKKRKKDSKEWRQKNCQVFPHHFSSIANKTLQSCWVLCVRDDISNQALTVKIFVHINCLNCSKDPIPIDRSSRQNMNAQ